MLPTIYTTQLFDQLDEFMLEFEAHDKEIMAGVVSEGEAAAYAEVWEWGNVRQVKPGPKTVIGTNPRGEMVWMSAQAPFGYIWTHEPEFDRVLMEEWQKVRFESVNAQEMTDELEKMALAVVRKVAMIIQDSAPFDRGGLRSSIHALEPGDSMLDEDTELSTLVLGEVNE